MIEKIVYEDNKITCITVNWGSDFGELLGVLRNFIDDNKTEYLLLDFRKFSFISAKAKTLKKSNPLI